MGIHTVITRDLTGQMLGACTGTAICVFISVERIESVFDINRVLVAPSGRMAHVFGSCPGGSCMAMAKRNKRDSTYACQAKSCTNVEKALSARKWR